MSQENNTIPRNGEGQPQQKAQSGQNSGQNRNPNRNRNRNRSRSPKGQGGSDTNQGGNRSGRRNGQGRSDNRQRGKNRSGGQGRQAGGGQQQRRKPRPVPLTLWEKVLKFFGLYKAPTRPPRRQSNVDKQSTQREPKAVRSNTRDTRNRTNSRDSSNNRSRQSRTRESAIAKGPGAAENGRNFPVENTRLYLGNLSYDASEHDLEDLFKGIGTVRKVEIIYNRHTHRSKGYGFIEMLNIDEAKRAVEVLHDQPFMGRNLIVNGANAKPEENDKSRNDNDAPKEDASTS